MNKTLNFTIFFILLTMLTSVTFVYTYKTFTPSAEAIKIRQSFTQLTGLPDLSVYTESPSERFRSIADTGSVFASGPFALDTDFSAIIYKKAKN